MPKTIAITYICGLCPKNKQQPLDVDDVITLRLEKNGYYFEQVFCKTHGMAVLEGAEEIERPRAGALVAAKNTASTSGKKGRISELREWAAGKKIELGPGRQKTEIIEQFERETGQSYWV